MSLTYKQEQFCQHYTSDAKGNASEAARLAGYSHRQRGDELVSKSVIQDRIRELTRSKDNFIALSRELAITKLHEAIDSLDATNPRNIPTLVKLLHEAALLEGWHAPSKYEDTSQAREINESIKVRQLELQNEQLQEKIKQLNSIIEVGKEPADLDGVEAKE